MKQLQQIFAAMQFQLFGLVCLAALSIAPARALSYKADYTGSCMSSITISAATSGVTSNYYTVRLYSTYGVDSTRVAHSKYSASINTSTYALTLSNFDATLFPNGFCGGVKINGMFGSSDTSATTDFKPVTHFTACYPSTCGSGAQVKYSVGNYSQRTYGGRTYATDTYANADGTGTGSCNGTVRAYLDPDTSALTFAHSVGASCLMVVNAVARTGSSYPTNSVHLGTWSQNYNNGFPQLVLTSDDRPW